MGGGQDVAGNCNRTPTRPHDGASSRLVAASTALVVVRKHVSREKGKRAAGTTQKIVCTANLLKVNSNRWNGATRQAVHEAFPMRRRTFWPWMLASVLLGPPAQVLFLSSPGLARAGAARQRGFQIDEDGFRKQLAFTHNVLAQWAKKNSDHNNFLGGQADTAGYALLTLALGDHKPDSTTKAVAEYLLLRNKELDHWRNVSNRPPSEATPFTTTALALHGLKVYGVPEQKERLSKRVAAARGWLLRTAAHDSEERVFRLWGLKYAQANPGSSRRARRNSSKRRTRTAAGRRRRSSPPMLMPPARRWRHCTWPAACRSAIRLTDAA
jgi:hypothetical protein